MITDPLHNTVADALELASIPDWLDPLVAFLEASKAPFGCKALAIALDSQEKPIYYLRLLEHQGIEILNWHLHGLRAGVCICNRALLMLVKKKDFPRAVKTLEKHGARLVY